MKDIVFKELKLFVEEETPYTWQTKEWKDIPSTYLYQFFDSIGIFVTLYHFDMGEFVPAINMYENYKEKNAPKEGHIELVFDGAESNMIFDTRHEAELAGFEKAFQIFISDFT